MSLKRRLWAIAGLSLTLGAVPAQAETIQVGIDRLVFSPAEITMKVGDTVEWLNKDILAHTATVKGGMDVMIQPKKSASLVLQKMETVEYYCRFHPNMKGRITVSAP
ncbi:cupredoxin family copper-binding protein [Bosea sp. 2YAB26]|uniref:cupredoxin domain-containing protein n=1 Tax=Bosea sp. 2YAB26 TaxID=3237478 RepID=UPI003F90A3DC